MRTSPTTPRTAVIDGRKWCPGCEETHPVEDFFNDKSTPSGLRAYCKKVDTKRVLDRRERMRIEQPEEWAAERHRALKSHRMRTYGITSERYDEMLAEQGGVCAIRGQPETKVNRDGVVLPLAVDHDHACCSGSRSCGKCVRGLLCDDCNTGLGRFEDNIHRLTSAVAYLIRGENNQD